MLTRVTLLCFAASYLVALLLELSRLCFGVRWRPIWMGLWTVAGLIAHSSYLVLRAHEGITARGAPLSNWFHWCLLAAWALALFYLLVLMSRPDSSTGLFVLPLVLGLIAVARLLPRNEMFSTDQATRVWGLIHGLGLLIGTVSVLVGFSTGLMYLVQSSRLKHKSLPSARMRLPSLEWLGKANERSLTWSVFWLVGGLLAGTILNLVRQEQSQVSIPWSHPTIWTSALLFFWLLAVTIFSLAYKPARLGRKIAYLTVANFVILTLTLAIVLFGPSDHASGRGGERVSASNHDRPACGRALSGPPGLTPRWGTRSGRVG